MARSTFKQADMTRAVRATIAAGLIVDRVEVDNGKISIVTKSTSESSADDLDRELLEFEARHAR